MSNANLTESQKLVLTALHFGGYTDVEGLEQKLARLFPELFDNPALGDFTVRNDLDELRQLGLVRRFPVGSSGRWEAVR